MGRLWYSQFQSRSRVAFGFRFFMQDPTHVTLDQFQSRSRVAFGFRLLKINLTMPPACGSFNLVLEWLLVSGSARHRGSTARLPKVSISFSSGFWFQVPRRTFERRVQFPRFQSRSRVAFGFRCPAYPLASRAFVLSFNLVLEWLLVSGLCVGERMCNA